MTAQQLDGGPVPASFSAFTVDHRSDPQRAGMAELSEDALSDAQVTVRVAWSSVNYKDALAASPTGRVARIFPLVPGIDLAGEVVRSSAPDVPVGQQVIAHGYGLGVTHHGGFCEYARVPADWVVGLPAGLSARQAMVLGTAGYTAALCVIALEDHGLTPGQGPVLVLGASGGVGSVAVSILAARGYEITAVTGKPEHGPWLRELGAATVVPRAEVVQPGRPLEHEQWAGCVDAVGGPSLEYALRTLRYGGAVASCGQVGGVELRTTVLPFILRGVSLLGIDSVATPIARRRQVWERLAGDLSPVTYGSAAVREITLAQLPDVLAETLAGSATGRTIVDVGGAGTHPAADRTG